MAEVTTLPEHPPVEPPPANITQIADARRQRVAGGSDGGTGAAGAPAVEPAKAPESAAKKGPEIAKSPTAKESKTENEKNKVDNATSKALADKIQQRKEAILLNARRNTVPREIDRMINAAGNELVDRLRKGEYSNEDMALAWFMITDEMVSRQSASGQSMREVDARQPDFIQRFAARHPELPLQRWLGEPNTQPQVQREQVAASVGQHGREVRAGQDSPDAALDHYQDLNRLRQNVEQAVFGRSFPDLYLDGTTPALFPSDRALESGNQFFDNIVHERENLLQREYPGRNFTELQREDPVAASRIMAEAHRLGLTRFAREAGKNVLTSRVKPVEQELIERRANEAEGKLTPEAMGKLEAKAEQARIEAEEADQILKALKTRAREIRKPEEEAIKAKSQVDALEAFFKRDDIQRLRDEIKELRARQQAETVSLQKDAATPTPPVKEGQQAKGKARQPQSSTSRDISALEQIIDKYNPRLLDAALKEAELKAIWDEEFDRRKDELEELEGEKDATGKKIGNGKIDQAEATFRTKQKAKETAEKIAKTKKAQQEKPKKENAEKAKALRWWGKVAKSENLAKIIDTQYSQHTAESDFLPSLLGNTAIENGQMQGTELIREHIFELIDSGNYDAALARKMLPDDAIARAIIYTFQLNPATRGEGGKTLERMLVEINANKLSAEQQPTAQHRQVYLDRAQETEQALLNTLLPNLTTASEFQVADMLRFIVDRGAKQAQKGDPFLKIPDRFADTKAETQLSVNTVLREDVGRATIGGQGGREVAYEGTSARGSQSLDQNGYPDQTLPLNYRIRAQFNQDSVDYGVDVQVNEQFLQSLPPQAMPGMPEEIQKRFYDEQGNLRTHLTGGDRFREFFRDQRLTYTPGVPLADQRLTFMHTSDNNEWITVRGGYGATLANPQTPETRISGSSSRVENSLDPYGEPTMASDVLIDGLAGILPRFTGDRSGYNFATLEDQFPAAVANTIIESTPTERQQLLHRFSPVTTEAITLPGSGEAHQFRVSFDNTGKFFVEDISNPNQPTKELKAFLQDQVDSYVTENHTHHLSVEERQRLHDDILLPFQDVIGREVLRSLQRQ